MAKAKPTEDLAAIFPRKTETIDVTLRIVGKNDKGRFEEREKSDQVFVRPMPARKWMEATTYLSKLVDHLPMLMSIDTSNSMQIGAAMIKVFGECSSEALSLLSLATDKPSDFFDQIDLDDLVLIGKAVFEVNKDFFAQKVWPLIAGFMAEEASTSETSGQTE